jgi:hypothetical protein
MSLARGVVVVLISAPRLKTVASGNADEPNLARIQQILGAKKMVELTPSL